MIYRQNRKILFVIDSMNGGGAEKMLLHTINLLRHDNLYSITLFIINGYGVLMNHIPKDIRIFIGNDLSVCDQQIFDSLTFDIEIAFLEGLAMKFVALRNSKATKVGWIHTDLYNNNWCASYYRNFSQEHLYARFDRIICVSEYCLLQFAKRFPNIVGKLHVCNNILGESFLTYDMPDMPQHERNYDTIELCFVGRLVAEKNPELIIDAMNLLAKRISNVHLSVVGDGYLLSTLKEKVREYGLIQHVTFHGYIDNPTDLIKKSTLLLSMSEFEGGPLNVAEALSQGVPIISSHSGGSDEFNHKYGGIIFTQKNYIELADTIYAVTQNNGTILNHVRNKINRSAVRQDFSSKSFRRRLSIILQ